MVRSVVIWLLLAITYARAETVALLPLDTEKRLEIYSQPVAAEIARALKAVGVDVVVVGAKMEVPENAQLIIDGTIKANKAKEVSVAMRIRMPRDGTVLENVPPQTAPLANIDKAAADVSAHVVPLVQKHLAELAKPKPIDKPKVVEGQPPAPVPARLAPRVVTAVSSPPKGHPHLAMLRDALANHVPVWAQQQKHEAMVVPGDQLTRKLAVKTIGAQQADVGISFEVLNLWITREDDVPMAWARVRVRIASGAEIKFERIVRTDTIVGERNMSNEALAARTAREVLAITIPHVRRAIATWTR